MKNKNKYAKGMLNVSLNLNGGDFKKKPPNNLNKRKRKNLKRKREKQSLNY